MIRAYSISVPTPATQAGAALAASYPSWSEAFHSDQSIARHLCHSVGGMIEDYIQEYFLWTMLYSPYGAVPVIREILDRASVLTAWPLEYMADVYYVSVPTKEVTFVKDERDRGIPLFPEIWFCTAYLRTSDRAGTDVCFLWPEFTEEGRETEDGTYHLVFLNQHESVSVEYVDISGNTQTRTSKPIKFHLWNQLDEWGLTTSLERIKGEHDWYYARRLMDIYLREGNCTTLGLHNALSRDFGLITHLGQVVLPKTLPLEAENTLKEQVRTAEPYEAPPRVLASSKFESLQVPKRIDTTRRSEQEFHFIFRVRGEGHIVVEPIPDVVHCFTSSGKDNDFSATGAYKATIAGGKSGDDYIHDSNALTIDVEWSEPLVEGDRNDPTYHDRTEALFILEYRTDGGSLPRDLIPVVEVYVRESTFDDFAIPHAPDYIIQNLHGRVFAVNEDQYKRFHFKAFDGPADYTEEQRLHYLGSNPHARGMDREWMNRHEAFTEITQWGLNRKSHDTVADEINDRTRVMWKRWRWGEGFWWDESIFDDPDTIDLVNRPTPGVENSLEFVPHTWDTTFRST